MNWLTAAGHLARQVTQDHCDRYLAERRLRKDATGTVVGTMEESAPVPLPLPSSSWRSTVSCSPPTVTATGSLRGTEGGLAGRRHAPAGGEHDARRRAGDPPAAPGGSALHGHHHRPAPGELAPQVQQRRRKKPGSAMRPRSPAWIMETLRHQPGTASRWRRSGTPPPAPACARDGPRRPVAEGELPRAGPRGGSCAGSPGRSCRHAEAGRASRRGRRCGQALGPPGSADPTGRRRGNHAVDPAPARGRQPRSFWRRQGPACCSRPR